jgi:RNA polymerase sigma factor (sigma-70 family)
MEQSAMPLESDGSTHPTLLKKVADWEDHPAWVRFRDTYNPLLWRWCRRYSLSDDQIEEVCQRIWIELADRMKTFEYDPNRTFRGWLRRLCESRVLNFLRQRRTATLLSLDDRDGEPTVVAGLTAFDPDAADEIDDLPHRFLLLEAERVQAAVRAKVKPHTWEAFWLVAVCDWSVERTAQSLGMSKVAVYAARDRVGRMLCALGKRVLDGMAAEV